MSEATDADGALLTRASLLSQLGKDPYNQSAWQKFESRYAPRIQEWCRRCGLQQADAEDVTQQVLVRLAVKLRGFRYDPARSFRAWLSTLTRHAWSDFIASRKHAITVEQGERAELALMTVAAGQDLEQRMGEAFDLEMLDLATRQVRHRVSEQTWAAFQMTALDGLSGADAAATLKMSVVSVFKAKSNVQKMLRETVAQLDVD